MITYKDVRSLITYDGNNDRHTKCFICKQDLGNNKCIQIASLDDPNKWAYFQTFPNTSKKVIVHQTCWIEQAGEEWIFE